MRGKPGKHLRFTLTAVWAAWFALADPAGGADLQGKTLAAFDQYVQVAEKQIDAQLERPDAYLWVESLPGEKREAAMAHLRSGQVVIERLDSLEPTIAANAGKPISVPGGLIHHWIGTVFIPGATLGETLALLEDYDHQRDYFHPDVMRSTILRRDGGDFTILLRLYKKKVITTVLDTEHQVHYELVDRTHAWSRSRTTRIQEVENAGEPTERLEPVGHDRGFLWRMNTYWRFEQKDGGTYVECQSISLTRDIPEGLGWMIGSYVTSVPRESLTFTLLATRGVLLRRIASGAS